MCQMCEDYEAELRRMGIEPEPRAQGHEPPSDSRGEQKPTREPVKDDRER